MVMILRKSSLLSLVTTVFLTGLQSPAIESSTTTNTTTIRTSKYVSAYTATDIMSFMSSFSSIPAYPTGFSWESSKIYVPKTSAKPIITSFAPAPLAPLVMPAALTSDGSLDLASLDSLHYEGVKCEAGTYKFPYVITDSNNLSQNGEFAINLPQAPQKLAVPLPNEDNSSSEQTISCRSKIPAVSGKVINGNIVFQCQAGLWRIKQIGCRDTSTSCNGTPTTLPVTTSANGSFPNTYFNVPAGTYPDGAASGVYVCKDVLPTPTTPNYQWSGNINLSCSNGTFSAASNNCQVINASKNIYPNCSTGILGYSIRKLGGVQTVGQACFPANTAMPYFNSIFSTLYGPDIYRLQYLYTPFDISYHWVKSFGVPGSIYPNDELHGCGMTIGVYQELGTTGLFGTVPYRVDIPCPP